MAKCNTYFPGKKQYKQMYNVKSCKYMHNKSIREEALLSHQDGPTSLPYNVKHTSKIRNNVKKFVMTSKRSS